MTKWRGGLPLTMAMAFAASLALLFALACLPLVHSSSLVAAAPPVVSDVDDIYLRWAGVILIGILAFVIFAAYILRSRRIQLIHESLLAIGVGMLCGGLVWMTRNEELQKSIAFDHRLFFNILLPPIILHSGFHLKGRLFFASIGPILLFALVGTLISALSIGLLIYLFAMTPLSSVQMTFLDSFIFGAILSSTDPVTVLSIFKVLKVDSRLQILILGESLLNDAVGIVLFETLMELRKVTAIDNSHMISAAISFIVALLGSFAVGVFVALLTALILKHSRLYRHPFSEGALFSLAAYSSYLLSNALRESGIVALLFFAIVSKRYCLFNLSLQSQRTINYVFGLGSYLSESFVFIYLGIASFTQAEIIYDYRMILYTMGAVLISRGFSIFPLSWMINLTGRLCQSGRRVTIASDPGSSDNNGPEQILEPTAQTPIPSNFQWMIWWTGLRGAISFALSLSLVTSQGNAQMVYTQNGTILAIVILSTVICGGTTSKALKYLKIQYQSGNSNADTEAEEELRLSRAMQRSVKRQFNYGIAANPNNLRATWMLFSTESFGESSSESANTQASTSALPPTFSNGYHSLPVTNTFPESPLAEASAGDHAPEGRQSFSGTSALAVALSSPVDDTFEAINGVDEAQILQEQADEARPLTREEAKHWFIVADEKWIKPFFCRTAPN